MSPSDLPPTCPSCGSTDTGYLFDRGDGRGIERCRACHVAFTLDLPSDLGELYDDRYFSGSAPDDIQEFGYADYEHSFRPTSFLWLTEYIRAIAPGARRLFDCGAATGTFMEMARYRRFDVAGSEMTADGTAVAVGKGLTVRAGVFDAADWDVGTFDVVTCLETLEHVLDPLSLVTELATLLTPGGVLVLYVPDVSDGIVDRFGPEANAFNSSYEHTLYFNEQSLMSLADRAFGQGCATVMTGGDGKMESAALVAIRPDGVLRVDTSIAEAVGRAAPTTSLDTPMVAQAVGLLAAKFYDPETAALALERAAELGSVDGYATARAQVLRYEWRLAEAVSVLTEYITTSGGESDPVASRLLADILVDMSAASTEPDQLSSAEEPHPSTEELHPTLRPASELQMSGYARLLDQNENLKHQIDEIHASRWFGLASTWWRIRERVERTVGRDRQRPVPVGVPPRVCVIVPVYNKGYQLIATVESICRQTITDVEIIVWDDGSDDPDTLVALDVVQRFPMVKLFRSPNEGLPSTRNKAIARSNAPFIVPLDADDTVEPTYLEKALLLLSTRPDIAFTYPWVQTVGDTTEIWQTHDVDPDLIAEVNHVPVCAMYRRDMFDALGGYRDDFEGFEDWELWVHATARGYKGVVIPEPLMRYTSSLDPAISMLARANRDRDRLTAEVKILHPDTHWTGPAITFGTGSVDLAELRIPIGSGRPVVVLVQDIADSGIVESLTLLTAWLHDHGRTSVVLSTGPPSLEGSSPAIGLLRCTPYVYQLPSFLPPSMWPNHAHAVCSALPEAIVLDFGTGLFDHIDPTDTPANQPTVRPDIALRRCAPSALARIATEHPSDPGPWLAEVSTAQASGT